MLQVDKLESGYGPMQVFWKPGLEIPPGSITSLLGPNGAGKSTLLTTVFGALPAWSGTVIYDGRDVTRLPSHKKVEMGLSMVPEGKHLFPNMTVSENLSMGAYSKKAQPFREETMEMVYSLFPRLRERSSKQLGDASAKSLKLCG